MKRGDVVLVALPGDFGKPRPAVVIQSDRFVATHATLLVCPLTTALLNLPLFRIRVTPTSENGIRQVSEIMVDKIQAAKRERIRGPIGHLDDAVLHDMDDSLGLFIGLAE